MPMLPSIYRTEFNLIPRTTSLAGARPKSQGTSFGNETTQNANTWFLFNVLFNSNSLTQQRTENLTRGGKTWKNHHAKAFSYRFHCSESCPKIVKKLFNKNKKLFLARGASIFHNRSLKWIQKRPSNRPFQRRSVICIFLQNKTVFNQVNHIP